jgi:hypothetical protein
MTENERKAWEIMQAYWSGELQKDQAEHKLAELRAERLRKVRNRGQSVHSGASR